MSKLRLDHIGIVVKNLHKTAAAFENAIGLPLEEVENYKEILNIGFVPVGSIDIEFLEPTTSEGLNADFLKDNGEGVHHIAFEVDDIKSEIKRLKKLGFIIINDPPKKGADNKLICFIHPKSTNHVLIELCQEIK